MKGGAGAGLTKGQETLLLELPDLPSNGKHIERYRELHARVKEEERNAYIKAIRGVP